MDKKQAIEIVNNSFKMIFGKPNPFPLETVFSKFAFDIKLPKKVMDSITGQETWTESIHSNLFITQNNMRAYDRQKGWMLPKQDVKNLKEIINIANGRRIGSIIDVVISSDGVISKLVVEERIGKRFLSSNKEDKDILWQQIVKIGDDIILVDLNE